MAICVGDIFNDLYLGKHIVLDIDRENRTILLDSGGKPVSYCFDDFLLDFDQGLFWREAKDPKLAERLARQHATVREVQTLIDKLSDLVDRIPQVDSAEEEIDSLLIKYCKLRTEERNKDRIGTDRWCVFR